MHSLHVQDDKVERVQFTTKDKYKVFGAGKKVVMSVSIRDPQPKVPDDFDLWDDVTLGDYVLVRLSSVTNLQKGKLQYTFRPDEGTLLTSKWEAYEEDLTVDQLVALGEDFLLYYQRVDTSGKASKIVKGARSKPLKPPSKVKKEPAAKKRK